MVISLKSSVKLKNIYIYSLNIFNCAQSVYQVEVENLCWLNKYYIQKNCMRMCLRKNAWLIQMWMRRRASRAESANAEERNKHHSQEKTDIHRHKFQDVMVSNEH